MRTIHEKLFNSTIDALASLFNDRSVSTLTTAKSLEYIKGEIDIMLDALKESLKDEHEQDSLC